MLDFFRRLGSIQASSLGQLTILILICSSIYNYKIVAAHANETIVKSPPIADLSDYFLGEPPNFKVLINTKPVNELLKPPNCVTKSADEHLQPEGVGGSIESESCMESTSNDNELAITNSTTIDINGSIEPAISEASRSPLVQTQPSHKISQNSPTLADQPRPIDSSAQDPETHQVTTKLTGQVIFAINGGGFSGDRIIAPRGAIVSRNQPNITSLYRASLDFDTRFSKTDLLKLRLVAGSPGIGDNAAGFLEPNLGSVLDFAIPGREQVSLARLHYTFAPTNDLNVTVGSQMVAADFVDKNRYSNASFRDFSTAALTNNFILLPRPGGAGSAINWNPNQGPFSIRGVYIASSAATSLPENQQFFGGGAPNDIRLFPVTGGGSTGGLFGDPYMGVVELEYAPTKSLTVRLQYSGGELLGSNFQVLGANAELAITPQVGLFARYGSGYYPGTTVGNIHPQYWSAGIAFQDIFTKNDLAGIGIAQPLILGEVGNANQTNFEAFYNIPINKNVRITPIVQVISNPANQSSNATITTGTIRTVFSF
jgi:Carbohydrate-selective porin, OprB family